jgi:hypothetical protein
VGEGGGVLGAQVVGEGGEGGGVGVGGGAALVVVLAHQPLHPPLPRRAARQVRRGRAAHAGPLSHNGGVPSAVRYPALSVQWLRPSVVFSG